MAQVCFTLSSEDITKLVDVYGEYYNYDDDVQRRIDESLPAITEAEFSRLELIKEVKQGYSKKKAALLHRANVPDSIDPT